MGLIEGTNCGFVTTAPTADPNDVATQIDTYADVSKYTSPATAIKITEMGWWCDNATQAANFEVGLYAANGAVVPGEAGTRLYVSATNAKGTTSGWKRVTELNWTISANTAYWFGIQVDDTTTTTNIDTRDIDLHGYDYITSSTLPNPFGGGAIDNTVTGDAIYAVWEAAAAGKVNRGINIGDAWKQISELYINIGDVWKKVSEWYINQGDVWKPIGA